MAAQTQATVGNASITSFRLSPLARINGMIFGSPNFRRANGIVEARFDFLGAISGAISRLRGRKREVPVYVCDRKGGKYSDRLPKIWLSERLSNTKRDYGRVMVECYPSSPDKNGDKALELGDRYLGEGKMLADDAHGEAVECFKAAEILYLHAVRHGNRTAVSRLHHMYRKDLCKGDYWKRNIEEHARHCKRSVGSWCLELS